MLWNGDVFNDHGIGCKWAPVLVYGPKVSVENALEFIRRTDYSLVEPKYSCNDRAFEEELQELLGTSDIDNLENFNEVWKKNQVFQEAFGHIPLSHLSSNWVACSYIFGPHGPVHPDGTVYMTRNFGKWPSIEEVETELDKLREFNWLTLNVYLWDNYEEKYEGDPTYGWKLSNGYWQRITEMPNLSPEKEDIGKVTEKLVASLTFGRARDRECTWSVAQIKEMWGDKISEARKEMENDGQTV